MDVLHPRGHRAARPSSTPPPSESAARGRPRASHLPPRPRRLPNPENTGAMDFQKLTIKAQEAFCIRPGDAISRGNPELTPDHLLVALLDQEGGVAPRILEKSGTNPGEVRAAAEARLQSLPRIEGAQQSPTASRALREALERSFSEAEALKDEYVAVEHFLLALADAAGLDRAAIMRAITEVRGGPARLLARRRGHLRGAAQVRPRPDRAGRARQARPGHRPRRGGAPRHPGAQPAHEEQPRADRRARRGQDRHRRGPRPAHHLRRRARGAARPARVGARRRLAARGLEVPRRVRGADEGRAGRDQRLRGPDHPLHRRAAHDRRRRRGRGRRRRRQHAEADARPRRAARDRRDDARRVPQAHREGRRARAPLPAGDGGRAERRRHDRHPARAEGALRGAPRRAHLRRRDRRGGDARRPLHQRPLHARQGDRPGRRGRVAPEDRDRLDARRDRHGPAAASSSSRSSRRR